MPCLALSNWTKLLHKAKPYVVTVCRVVLALTFLFSGWVKANDPLGTSSKLGEYVTGVGLRLLDGNLLLLTGAIGLAFVEFTLGLAYVLGRHRRATALLGVAFLVLMTVLTLWLALFNPVSDCGCFGDVLILSNWQTFGKNLFLLACAIMVLREYKMQKPLLGESVSWLVSLPCMVGIVAYAVYCVICLPRVDFRPYYEGVNLQKAWTDACSVTPDEDDPPTTFKSHRKDVMELFLYNPKTMLDMTDSILHDEGVTLLLVAPSLRTADQGCVGDVNMLFEEARERGYAMYCLTASEEQEQRRWVEYTGAEYPFLLADEQLLKTMVRANPGLLLLRNGVIVRKWSNWNLPNEKELHSILSTL